VRKNHQPLRMFLALALMVPALSCRAPEQASNAPEDQKKTVTPSRECGERRKLW